MARDQAAGLVQSRQGRVLACTFLDTGKILLYNVLGRCLYGAASKQIFRGKFLGGSGSGLLYQVIRFEPLSWHQHTKCSRRSGWLGVQNGALGGS